MKKISYSKLITMLSAIVFLNNLVWAKPISDKSTESGSAIKSLLHELKAKNKLKPQVPPQPPAHQPQTTAAANSTNNNDNSAFNHPLNNNSQNQSLASNMVVLNFENADIQSVIKAISDLSGKNFVIDPRVKGTVNIVSDKPIAKVDSYKVLEAALRMQGFAAVEADGVIKVIPEPDVKGYGMQIENNFDRNNTAIKRVQGDQVITKVFILSHGSAIQVANALRPLIAPNNSISVYTNSNAIIITDYASNIARLTSIINQISGNITGDISSPVIVNLQYAVAADVAQILQSYLGNTSNGGGGGGGGYNYGNQDGPTASITVDPNANTLIITSPVQTKANELRDLALKIDKDTSNSNSNLHVVYLKNADAMHIADVLRSIVSGQENPDITASSSQSKFATEPSSTFGASGSSGGSGSGGGTGISAQAKSNGGGSRQNGGSNAANQKDQPKVVVQAEPTTNSLIIEAPQAVYKNLRMIIDMLDIRRAQVMIEAMIADISATQSGTLGVQWLVGAGNNNGGLLALGNYGQQGNSLSGLATSIAGAGAGSSSTAGATGGGINVPNQVYVGLVTGTTTVGGQTIPTLGALADMISANSVGNVLSRPTMITLDNEEAKILVGSNIGIPNGSYQSTAAQAGSLVTTITRQDLGTVLQIKPMITQSGAIQLDIWQENSLLDPNQPINANTNGPSFLKRNLRATVLVDDGQIIALGGMTQDSVTITQNGVPGLSDIPYIGWLFSWEQRVHTKANLVLFLRPVIIKNAEGYKALTNQRYSYIVGQQKQAVAKGTWALPEIKPVTLDNQVPYANHGALPGQNNPSLNLNKNLPIVDLTHNGDNVSKSDSNAVSLSTDVIESPADLNNNNATPVTQMNSLTQ
ncbi:MAG: type II secretion system secretin GspD [Burkholderiales bacterium]|nr:type II secretion system secretin GspD [Burkholderiales bacterium]